MQSDKSLFLFLGGIALLAYAIGIMYVTWIRPSSSARPVLRARWQYWAPASALGAATQVATFGSLGLGFVLAAFELPIAKWAFTAFFVSLIFACYARIADIGERDER